MRGLGDVGGDGGCGGDEGSVKLGGDEGKDTKSVNQGCRRRS